MRVALLFGCVPLTQVRSERPGVSICAFWNWDGVAPGHQVHQRLVVAVLVQREVGDLLRRQLRVQIGLVGLEQRRLAGHLDPLGELRRPASVTLMRTGFPAVTGTPFS